MSISHREVGRSGSSGPIEIRAFAESILYATDLETKCRGAEDFNDDDRGQGIDVPDFPARPASDLTEDERSEFPRIDALDDPDARCRMLAAFAHHELLATELMALMLLRFPDAPSAFRRGLVEIMQDEQRHLMLYVERIRELGGSFDARRSCVHFWTTLSNVTSPLEFVAGMGLGFEQANLDFALEFKDAMQIVGDDRTASLLDEVHRDELRHVRFGRLWFERWSKGEDTPFERWRSALPSPLSPRHGKGRRYSRTARYEAGFDDDWIDRLEVFSASRGRPPRIFVFNPLCETEIAADGPVSENAAAASVRRDLEGVMLFLAAEHDVVVMERPPRTEFLLRLKRAGFQLPEIVTPTDLDATRPFDRHAAGAIEPWGRSPAIARRFAGRFDDTKTTWSSQEAHAFRKSSAAALLELFLLEEGAPFAAAGRCGGTEIVGRAVHGIDAADAAVVAFAARGARRIVIKADLSMSGRERIFIDGDHLDSRSRSWVERMLATQKTLIVEPWLERMVDFSIHLTRTADGKVRVDGTTRFHVDSVGRYRGAEIGAFVPRLPKDIRRFFCDEHGKGWLGEFTLALARQIERVAGFRHPGPSSIDAFVYREIAVEGPVLRLKPVVEINPRHTMGRVALTLARRVRRGVPARWIHVTATEAETAGFANLEEMARELSRLSPIRTMGPSDRPLISDGVVETVDCRPDTRFGAFLVVGEALGHPAFQRT